MSEQPPPLPPNRTITLLVGMVVANLVGGGLALGLTRLLALYKGPHEDWITRPSIFLVPFIAGLAAAWCWRRLNLGVGLCALHALTTTLLSIAAAAVFLREGAVCLVMAFPVLYVAIFLGVLAGRLWFKFGLYDMSGNVWEWCMDSWNAESRSRVLRGGSWYNGAVSNTLLSSCRIYAGPDISTDNYGFRCVIAKRP